MSTKYKHSHEVPTAVLAKRLDELSDAVGKRGEERDRELTRRVPAELDRDADLVLLEAGTRLLKMEAKLARADDRAQRQRQLEAQLQSEINTLEARLVELETERDALAAKLRGKVERLLWELAETKDERDTLATRVERLEADKEYLHRRRGELVIERDTLAAPNQDMVAHMYRQIAFSTRAFGPGDRQAGVIDHIRKELHEIEEAPDDLEEWIDVVLLALDGAWRSGHTAEEVVGMLDAKLTKNESREWPDWRTADPTKAIEHDRTKDREATE